MNAVEAVLSLYWIFTVVSLNILCITIILTYALMFSTFYYNLKYVDRCCRNKTVSSVINICTVQIHVLLLEILNIFCVFKQNIVKICVTDSRNFVDNNKMCIFLNDFKMFIFLIVLLL